VPADEEVQAYVDYMKGQLDKKVKAEQAARVAELEKAAATAVAEEATKIEEVVFAPQVEIIAVEHFVSDEQVTIEEPPVVEIVEATAVVVPEIIEEIPATKPITDPLTIQGPRGVIVASTESPKDYLDYGVTMKVNSSRSGGFNASGTASVGLAIHPFFTFNAFSIGLQGYFLEAGSLTGWQSWDHTNITVPDFSGILKAYRSFIPIIDFVRYGSTGDTFYLNIDDFTPITFGNGLLVNEMNVSSGLDELRLGLYGQLNLKNFTSEFFWDDVYLTELASSRDQFGGVSFTFNPEGMVSFGLSTLLKVNTTTAPKLVAYPSFDVNVKIKDERRVRLGVFLSGATAIGISPFSLTSVYDGTKTKFEDKLPNFLVATGIDLETLDFDMRFEISVENSADKTLSKNFLNPTLYNGSRLVAIPIEKIHWNIGFNAAYSKDRFTAKALATVPISLTFNTILPTVADASINADVVGMSLQYTMKNNLEVSLGFRRVGFTTSLRSLFDFSSGWNTRLYDFFFEGKNTQPYASLSYQSGMLGISGEFSMMAEGSQFLPRFDLSSSITISTKSIEQITSFDPSITVFNKKTDNSKWSVGLTTFYTRVLRSSLSSNYLAIKPKVSYVSDMFAISFGPRILFNFESSLAPGSWYSHDDSAWYSFGSDYTALAGKIYDAASDIFGLIDHMKIGTEASAFHFQANRNLDVELGDLIRGVSSNEDGPFVSKLAAFGTYENKWLELSFFINDLSDMQLTAAMISISPFAKWKASLDLGLTSNIILGASLKRIDAFPSLGLAIPVIENEKLSVAVGGSFTTMLGYDTNPAVGFKQMLVTGTSGSIINDIDNYLLVGRVDLAFKDNFKTRFVAGIQEGVLSYGMFDSFYFRNQEFMNNGFNDEWTNPSTAGDPRSLFAGVSASLDYEKFDVDMEYIIPFSTSFAPQINDDKVSIKGSLDTSFALFEAGYAKKNFLGGVNTLITGPGAITSRIIGFLLDGTSQFHAGATIGQGPIELKASAAAIAQYQKGTAWNDAVALPATATTLSGVTIAPALTVQLNINLF
jgi:hypothetical protein